MGRVNRDRGMISPIRWNGEAVAVELLDQTQLPVKEVWLTLTSPNEMAEAIEMLRVRGAPAIGIAAAYGVVLALRAATSAPHETAIRAIDFLGHTRPTAVNLSWSLARMRAVVTACGAPDQSRLREALLSEARAIEAEDRAAGRKLGEYGLSLLRDGMTVLTHCHTGGVATSGYGTALAPFILGAQVGVQLSAYVDETRPLLQGSRITAWELAKAGVEATLITDSMAGHVMRDKRVDAIIVGADRIAANGDVANKIGTYALAVLARVHTIPFYVSAPLSTLDLAMPSGGDIVIEERAADEITHGFGRQTAPVGISVYNPAFDITPAEYVSAIITECGVVRPPYAQTLQELA